MKKPSILVVEDDTDIQQLVSYNLIKAGFNVTCADSGEEALQLLGREHFDAMVLDLMLPGKDGKEIWIEVWAEFTGKYGLTIVEKEAMKQEVEANAAAMGSDIKTTGHVSIYGIYFDTGKAEVKSESQAALKEIAKLLASDPGLKLYVVGHTDSVGRLETNMKLSQARAEAVVQALTKNHGVAATRLKAQGAGQIAPVSSNRTEEGRAKNRRVELVEQ